MHRCRVSHPRAIAGRSDGRHHRAFLGSGLERHALGTPGRARGVHHLGPEQGSLDVVLAVRRDAHFVVFEPIDVSANRQPEAWPRTSGDRYPGHIREARFDDQHLRITVFDDVIGLLRRSDAS